ncbi:MAG: S-layer protein, partial [Limisphaerales bacterium]
MTQFFNAKTQRRKQKEGEKIISSQDQRAKFFIASLSLCAFALIFLTSSLRAAESLVILPEKFTLSGPAAHQSLVVEKSRDNHFVGQITNAIFTSSNPKIVKIQNGIAIPLANGIAILTAKAGRKIAQAKVAVEQMEKPFEWSFRNHVQPVLTKAGCNAGACHGAAAGQNGLKLSLRGYDDESDFLALTRQSLGRRVNENDPGRSMILIKPTTAVPHKGGKRFEINSIDYRVLADWISAATPGPKKEDPRIQKIEILPENVVLKPGLNQQLIV